MVGTEDATSDIIMTYTTWYDILTPETLALMQPADPDDDGTEIIDSRAELIADLTVEGLTHGYTDLKAWALALLALERYYNKISGKQHQNV